MKNKSDVQWSRLHLSRLGPIGAIIQRLPTGPAIYSFCLDVTIREKMADDELLAYLRSICMVAHGVDRETCIGPHEKIRLVHQSGIPFSALLTDAKRFPSISDPVFREHLAKILDSIQEIIPPLYIGETLYLQDRVGEHLAMGSPLRTRLEQKGIEIEKCVVRYCEVAREYYPESSTEGGVDDSDNDSELTRVHLLANALVPTGSQEKKHLQDRLDFIEELLSRIVRPRFINKLGTKNLGDANGG